MPIRVRAVMVAGLALSVLAVPAPPPTVAAPQAEVPAWLTRAMAAMVGRWTADNAAYRSDREPADAYGITWEWGAGRQSVVGRLYTVTGGRETDLHWQFRVFWHPGERRAVVQQFGSHGVVGIGELKPLVDDTAGTEADQRFYSLDGSSARVRHVETMRDGVRQTASFDWVDGAWQPRRTYTWRRGP
jgi:hypothetical protein